MTGVQTCALPISEYTTIRNKTRNKISTRPQGYSGMLRVFNSYKRNAKKRNLSFEINLNDFKRITTSNCYFCGIAPNTKSSLEHCKVITAKHSEYIYNGIDRLNNDKGYTLENSVPCCVECNRAKRNYTLSQFENWIIRISTYLNKKKELELTAQ